MPVTKDIISSLKRTNISVDEEKTKLRVKDDFISLRNKQKAAIVELTGLKRTSIYRVFREGNISAKIVLALSQALNVTPYYYTGETDDKGEFNDMLLQEFLNDKGYSRQAERIAQKMGDAPAGAPSKPLSGSFAFPSEFTNSPGMNEAVSTLSEDDAVQLLLALLIRAKTGGSAAQLADFVKRCLLM
ncbi:MAG: hypothetical protein LBR76_02745 [Oscillospiraceae bacterium]|jgi:hypothetical protein|nr:hypothetical protein [Oscillospiraceae bacterium]